MSLSSSLLSLLNIVTTTCLSVSGIGLLQFTHNHHLFVITSASMSPTIPTGSLVAIKPVAPPYMIGQVVAFQSSQGIITHRIIDRQPLDAYWQYHTQGDANPTADPVWITNQDVVGVVTFSVPYLGYLVRSLRTPVGFAGFILLPTTLLILQELHNMKHAWRELRAPHQVLPISFLLLMGSLSLCARSAHGLLVSNPVIISPNVFHVASNISPTPTPTTPPLPSPGPCDLNVTVNMQNINTGPGSTNVNQGSITQTCQQTVTNVTNSTNVVNIQVH